MTSGLVRENHSIAEPSSKPYAASSRRTSLPSSRALFEEVNSSIDEIFSRLDIVQTKLYGESYRRKRVPFPMVLLLGNHSSGKSTFVNYLLGTSIQETGRAQTDDSFTIVVDGEKKEQLDSDALSRNPSLGFSELMPLLGGDSSLVTCKLLPGVPLLRDKGIALVDSVGLIDVGFQN